MKTWIFNHWSHLRSSFWFVPAALSVLGIGLSLAMIRLDEQVPNAFIERLPWLWVRGPDGALALLSTIAGSMVTIAGVVFSITIVALTLASSQFGPRLLRNFMRDPGNQISLGTFISTFLYCLFIIRAVKGGETEDAFVPFLSITVALFLAVANLGVLIYFIHHMAVSIQAPHVVALVAADLHNAIRRLFPDSIEKDTMNPRPAVQDDLSAECDGPARFVLAQYAGYVQAIDIDGLIQVAKEADLVIKIERRPGHFVVTGAPLVQVWPATHLDDIWEKKVTEAYILGLQRTEEQDVEYAIDQLVEVAVRALSPGINDPFTANNCIDRLGEALCQLTRRVFPSPYHYDKEQRLRVIESLVTFPSILEAAFNQIRQNGRTSVSVTIRLLETLEVIARCVQAEQDRIAIRTQAIMVRRGSEEGLPEEFDRLEVERRYQSVMAALRGESAFS
ncbi:DUF2254 domain-containing protein [Nitrospira sp. M1]